MKKILIMIFALMCFVQLFAETEPETDGMFLSPEEELLCREVAEDLLNIYRNWDTARDYDILYPRVKEFINDFYASFPDFELSIVEKESRGENLSDMEKRKFIAFKSLRDDKIYEEVARFITTRDFYWGYISKDIHESLDAVADIIKKYVDSRSEEMLSEQEIYVAELLENMRMLNEELTEDNRMDYIWAREDWIEAKRITLFDLKEEEYYRLTGNVTDLLSELEEENGIGPFDISNEMIVQMKNQDNEADELFRQAIRNKFFGSLSTTFGSYVLYDQAPVFRTFRTNVLIGTLLFMVLFFYVYLKVRKSRENMFIRKIPGLDAIDDAVGRATEMGKPIVYDSGLGGYTHIDTIASMLILKSISKKVAEFKAEIYVPTCDPIILQISEEMVASGFLDAGYPEDHKKDNIFFIAYDQFAFAAGVAGILARKKPATAFHFGYYYAESLLISEAGFSAGAIQVAGTTAVSQIPFFITACDYTLIGEELYAAAAYISRDPQILTNLKLSDYAKLAIGILFIIGTIMLTINSEWTFLQDLIYTR